MSNSAYLNRNGKKKQALGCEIARPDCLRYWGDNRVFTQPWGPPSTVLYHSATYSITGSSLHMNLLSTHLHTKEFIDKSRHRLCCDSTSQRLTNRRCREQFSKGIWAERGTHGWSGYQFNTAKAYFTLVNIMLCIYRIPRDCVHLGCRQLPTIKHFVGN